MVLRWWWWMRPYWWPFNGAYYHPVIPGLTFTHMPPPSKKPQAASRPIADLPTAVSQTAAPAGNAGSAAVAAEHLHPPAMRPAVQPPTNNQSVQRPIVDLPAAAFQQPLPVGDDSSSSDASHESPPPAKRPAACLERHIAPTYALGQQAEIPADAAPASTSPPVAPPTGASEDSSPGAAAGGGARAAFAASQQLRQSTCNLSLLPPSE